MKPGTRRLLSSTEDAVLGRALRGLTRVGVALTTAVLVPTVRLWTRLQLFDVTTVWSYAIVRQQRLLHRA